MAEAGAATAVADPANPNLNLTPDEKRVFGQLFQAADTENVGVVTGEVAVKFFEKSRLEPRVLGEIWQIADTENRGFLTPAGFGVTLRLIAHVQAGRLPTPELAYRPGPLPRFDGFATPATPAAASALGGLQPQLSGGPIRVPPLTPDKANEYATLFEKSGAQDGILAGDQAKQIFERARLPNEVLGRIWNLADTEQRGALGVTEFTIAMHLLASFKSGALRALPNILPPGLYDAAARRGAPGRPPYVGGSPPTPLPGVNRQFSGTGIQRADSPMSRSKLHAPPQSHQTTGSDWAIGPKDKMHFDSVFAGLDKAGRGFITGEEAVGFFGNSRLPEEMLAQIWDLADINSEGRLARDEFAVAMHLIRQQRGSQEGRGSLPATLPPSLIPPSMRQQSRPPAQPTAPAFDNAAYATTKSASEDLFGLDAFATSSPPSQAAPASAGSPSLGNRAREKDVFGNATQPASPTLPHPPSTFKPFVPSSSFGQTMMTGTNTGNSIGSGGPTANAGAQARAAAVEDDLLGDNDPEVSQKLTAETTELANLSNQVGTLSSQMQAVKSKRASAQQDLSTATTQKREFEARLSQLRALYEREVKEVRELDGRLSAARNETRRLQQDTAMIEGTYADLQTQHQQLAAALEADRRENASLKERMRVVNQETSQLRPQLEKLRSDARQQKGLVAINKKQLATNEAEQDKVRTEIHEATRAAQETSAPSAHASTRGLPPVSRAGSPAPTPASQQTNPFFRKPSTSNAVDSAATPPALPPNVTASPVPVDPSPFDNVFGPSFGAPPASSSPFDGAGPEEATSQDQQLASGPSGPSARSSDGTEVGTPLSSAPASTAHDSPRPSEPPLPPPSRQSTLTQGANEEGGQGTGAIRTGESASAFEPVNRSLTGSTGKSDPHKPDGRAPERSDSFKSTTGAPEIPGAFPDESAPASQQPTPTGNSTLDDSTGAGSRAAEANRPPGHHGHGGRGDSMTLGMELPPRPTAPRDDFDAAFAGIGPAKIHPETTGKHGARTAGGAKEGDKFNTEFPPIEEFGNDDDSDSPSERGFDDNFTSPSPHRRQGSSNDVKSQAPPPQPQLGAGAATGSQDAPGASSSTLVRPDLGPKGPSDIAPPPTAGEQKSPPTYSQTMAPAAGSPPPANQLPAEYAGLLPQREDAVPPQEAHEKSFLSQMSGGQTLFGRSSSSAAPGITQPDTSVFSAAPALSNAPAATGPSETIRPNGDKPSSAAGGLPPEHPAKVPFDDDFDQDFADLDDAKEADDLGEEVFGSSTTQADGLDEFSPVFDSPALRSARPAGSYPTPPGKAVRPADGFNDVEKSVGGTASSPAAQPSASTSTHDWDAIFAGLDAPGAAGNGSAGTGSLPGVPPKEPIRCDAGPPGAAKSNGTVTASATRPTVGRALTAGTDHDDPILKKLTGMGYARDAALDALERYDYNITKAADFLVQNVQQK